MGRRPSPGAATAERAGRGAAGGPALPRLPRPRRPPGHGHGAGRPRGDGPERWRHPGADAHLPRLQDARAVPGRGLAAGQARRQPVAYLRRPRDSGRQRLGRARQGRQAVSVAGQHRCGRGAGRRRCGGRRAGQSGQRRRADGRGQGCRRRRGGPRAAGAAPPARQAAADVARQIADGAGFRPTNDRNGRRPRGRWPSSPLNKGSKS